MHVKALKFYGSLTEVIADAKAPTEMAPVGKRKRALGDFDPNKSDSDDENFDPVEERPRKSTKRRAAPVKGRSRSNRYRGSDVDDESDVLESEDEGSFAQDEDDDDDAEINAAGRRARKAATQRKNYKEDTDDDSIPEPASEEDKKPHRKKIITLKIPTGSRGPPTRRSTRAHTEDVEEDDFVELSNSGRHSRPARSSKSHSPEAVSRARSSRAMKSIKTAPEPIPEATQESSVLMAQDVDELAQDEPTNPQVEVEEEEDVIKDSAAEDGETAEAAAVEPTVEDDDEDDAPITRRTRASRTSASAMLLDDNDEAQTVEDKAEGTRRRLARKSSAKKSMAEPSSDFEPGNESEDAAESAMESDGKKHKEDDDDDDDDDSSAPRGRRGRRARPQPPKVAVAESADELELDQDELAEELHELRQDSRSRRRRRPSPPIIYQETKRRRATAKPVSYYMPPLTSANIEEDEQEPAATPARRRGGRGGGTSAWERAINTTYGPFGGGGAVGSLLAGPWGTGATGGVDSDSSDDEMVHRTGTGGNVGMTPTSGAPQGLLPGLAQPVNVDGAGGVGATPNVGKVKNTKALADADPLGVDMNVDFSQVGGLKGHIDQLKEMVQLPLLYPELFARFHVTPPRGVLFHGPPGTGKTLLARALANSVSANGRKITFYMRKGADALSKWVGEAEKQLRLLFEEARRTQPSIIFFDEIDGLAPVRSSKQEQIHASIVSTLLALMDGMDGRGQVIVIGATNRPDNIDPALRRPGRFDREFYFPLPDVEGRRSIVDIHTKGWGLQDSFKDQLAVNTKGCGGADLRALCTEAAINSIQRTYPQIYSSKEKLIVDAEKIDVHATDFIIALKKLVPSSERSASSGAAPLAKAIEPLLCDQFKLAVDMVDAALPRKKKLTALEEAMFEQFRDADGGFGRETMNQEFERSRIFRPRLLLHGPSGMGQGYLASAILHHLEGVHVQNFDLPNLVGDGRVSRDGIAQAGGWLTGADGRAGDCQFVHGD